MGSFLFGDQPWHKSLLTMTRCLVTGGAGFIGTHLIENLLAGGDHDEIVVLDLEPPRIRDSRVTHVHGDIRRAELRGVTGPYTTCYHLAALCKEPGYEWDEYFATNYAGTQNVCALASRLQVQNLIYTSTMMVFRAGDHTFSEDDLKAPDTAYGQSKLLGEHVVREWGSGTPGRRARIVRPGVVFGRGESANYTRLYYALKKRRFAYIGRDSTIKGSIYVKDLVAFLRFLETPQAADPVYNLVYPEPLTIREICETMCSAFGFSTTIPTVPYRLALAAGYMGEAMSLLGLHTPLHHRRIQKLYYSTDVSARRALDAGFALSYPLREALEDWRADCQPKDIY